MNTIVFWSVIRSISIVVLFLCFFIASGCYTIEDLAHKLNHPYYNLVNAAGDMADGLLENAAFIMKETKQPDVSPSEMAAPDSDKPPPEEKKPEKNTAQQVAASLSPVIVTAFVDIGNNYRTTSFGKLFTELFITELQARGFSVLDFYPSTLYGKEGDFVIPDDIGDMARKHNAPSVFAGTYMVTNKFIVFNGRIVNVGNSGIITAWANKTHHTSVTRHLLEDSGVSVYERIPLSNPQRPGDDGHKRILQDY